MDEEAIRRSTGQRNRVGAPTLDTATQRVAWEALRQGM